MKNKRTYRLLIVAFVTLVALWAIPALVKIASVESKNDPFVYYSSVVNKFCLKETEGKKGKFYDTSGTNYTLAQFDSILPMLNYRQLMVNGLMPDTIQGVAIEPKQIRLKSFVFKYAPTEINTPQMGLYIMYESLSGRVNLESPGDVFRMNSNIEFIDIKSNSVNQEKSRLFEDELIKRGYTFPSQWASGNMSIRKAYDEGYFSLDSKGQLFHIKMVNGRPFVRNTFAGEKTDIAHFSMLEVADKRFYGFVFNKSGNIYILVEDSGKYNLQQLDMAPIDLNKDEVMIMANMFFWTVSVSNAQGRQYYALNNETLAKVDTHHINAKSDKWDKLSKWIFPYHLTFSDKNNDYIYPRMNINGYYALFFNIILGAITGACLSRRNKKAKIFNVFYVLITGLAGMVAIWIIPDFEKFKN